MAKLISLTLALTGLAAGTGAGYFLRPTPTVHESTIPVDGHDKHNAPTTAPESPTTGTVEYVKLNNQFVVPVMENDRVAALVVLSLSLEVTLGERATVYQLEPKLRDAFLRVMFDHANTGGFKGVFTASTTMTELRRALVESARKILGSQVRDVLIIDLVRQDT